MKTSLFIAAATFAGTLLLGGCGSASDPAPELATAPRSTILAADAAPTRDGYGDTHKLVYVPTYSHIFTQDQSRNIDLAATLSIRNTDPDRAITIDEVTYFDSDGGALRSYIDDSMILPPLASRSFVVAESDRLGGAGANFLVEWRSSEVVSGPLIETVMISTRSTQGISFVSRGVTIRPIDLKE